MSMHASSPTPHRKARQGPLFAGVAFYVSPTLSAHVYADLCKVLETNGGESVPMEEATHIITDTDAFDDWRNAASNAHIVTSFWVDRSIAVDQQQNPQGFSPDPRKLFSGVVACSADLPQGDKETMHAAITGLGGQWREMLTRDVTHLFCLTTKSEKYAKAMGHRAQSQVRILLPHWFDDSFNARRLVPYEPYSFPNPPLFDGSAGLSVLGQGVPLANESAQHKEILFKTATLDVPPVSTSMASVDIWHGRRVYLSSSLELYDGRRTAVESMLERGGAKIVTAAGTGDSGEVAAVAQCDVLVTRYRDGPVFGHALQQGKVIGTLPWVLHVDQKGRYSAPTDQLLHFPVPSWPIDGFPEQRITITNYSGPARDYLKKLVEVTGASFTATLSNSNTHVIAASLSGKKTDKARAWGIAIVNHVWLEDCFLRWKFLTPANEKYIRFPHAGDMGSNVGECAIGRYTFEMWEEEQAHRPGATNGKPRKSPEKYRPTMSEAGDPRADVTGPLPTSRSSEYLPATGTNASMRDAYEVEADLIPTADTLWPSSPSHSPRRGIAVIPLASTSKRRFSDGDDEGRRPQRSSPLKRFKTDLSLGSADKSLAVAQDVIEIEDWSDDAVPPAQTQAAYRATRTATLPTLVGDNVHNAAAARGRKRARENKLVGERQSSPRSPSAKRSRPAKSQFADAHEAQSATTQIPRRRPKNVDSAPSPSEQSTVDDAPEPEDDSQRRRSGRAAAAKATRALKEVVMPDVLKFETQEKRGKRVGDLDDESPRGQPAAKKNTLKKYNNRKSTSVEDDDEPEIDNPPLRRKKEASATQPARKVFYLATQVTISEAQAKVLAQLGAKPTSKPEQVTHLIADQVVRTQKFLTAINYAPFIVNGAWVKDSVEQRCLLPEEDYLLDHPASSAKYGVDLAEAVGLANKYKGTLLRGCTFYVTPNAVADHELVKAVVKSAGGEVKEKPPSLRQAQQENTYVISHKKDSGLWRPLTRQGVAIYNSDLLLNGVLRQKLPVNDESCRLQDI